MSFFGELKRRNVVRVGIAYVVIGWALAQVAEFAVDNFDAPEWTLKIFVVFLLLGLPLVLFFAWAFEITPEGLKREKDVDRSQSITTQTGRKLDFIIIGVLVLAVGLLLVDKFYLGGEDSSREEIVATMRESIVVLPFANFSDDNDNFADGLSEELMNLLAKNPDLRVIGRTSSFVFKERNEDLREIGETLGVGHILEGSVRRSGNQIRVTAQLIDVKDASHLWSDTYDRPMTDIFEIQDDVANAISGELKLRLVPESKRVTNNIEAYAKYLEALALFGFADTSETISLLNQAVALDTEFAKAYELLAMAYWLASGTIMDSPSGIRLVYESATKALELDPSSQIAKAFAASADGTTSVVDYFRMLESAIELEPKNIRLLDTRLYDLLTYGYYEEALEIAERMIAVDPLRSIAHTRKGQILSAIGRRVEAREVYRHVVRLGNAGGLVSIYKDYLIAGDYERAIQAQEEFFLATGADPSTVRPFIESVLDQDTGKEFLDAFIHSQYEQATDPFSANSSFFWYQNFGYMDDFWREIERIRTETDGVWSDADELVVLGSLWPLSGMRRHPGFVDPTKVQLWDARGAPDICSKETGEWVCESINNNIS